MSNPDRLYIARCLWRLALVLTWPLWVLVDMIGGLIFDESE